MEGEEVELSGTQNRMEKYDASTEDDDQFGSTGSGDQRVLYQSPVQSQYDRKEGGIELTWRYQDSSRNLKAIRHKTALKRDFEAHS
ncbi:MAG: hypothetical protein EZS28_031834, partial [Streblomastix strix]